MSGSPVLIALIPMNQDSLFSRPPLVGRTEQWKVKAMGSISPTTANALENSVPNMRDAGLSFKEHPLDFSVQNP